MQLARLKATIKGLFLALGVAGLASCGSGDESGGGGACGGADETGVCLFVVEKQVSDVDEGRDVDVIQNPNCTGVLVAPFVVEDFVIARTEVTFGAAQIGPALPSASLIIITGYTISYAATPPVFPVVAPAIISVAFTGDLTTIPVNGTGTANVDLFNFTQKADWVTNFTALNGVGPGNVTYSATYEFFGEDDLGESVSVVVPTSFDLANFNNC